MRKLLCLFGFHKWEKHIAWDNMWRCRRCAEMRARTFCCNAKIIIDERKEQRFCSECKKQLEKCELILDHQVVWDGRGYVCLKCGIEFVPKKSLI